MSSSLISNIVSHERMVLVILLVSINVVKISLFNWLQLTRFKSGLVWIKSKENRLFSMPYGKSGLKDITEWSLYVLIIRLLSFSMDPNGSMFE